MVRRIPLLRATGDSLDEVENELQERHEKINDESRNGDEEVEQKVQDARYGIHPVRSRTRTRLRLLLGYCLVISTRSS